MPKLEIDTDYIEKLADIIGRTGLTEIELSHGDMRIRVARQVQMVVEAAVPRGAHPDPVEAPTAAPPRRWPRRCIRARSPHPWSGPLICRPIRASPSFVTVGEDVKEGQTLLIIEAMKVMNAIRAPRSGRVTRVIVHNAAPVEYGEPLMVIE